ncbi:hypothetical protein MICH65_0133 [Candidatus Chazhemtobacterium aquaticus]|uniref:Uncharacterized protein n=1 Tax=Candidatus Chazhemtobacterium aquaticus TaxID=2715735 RepID=A0A857N563_9BACT|nr:hypothetical protein MICH65_0133 [Candidatus Chazhemtobacterium aquaticus]
MVERVCIYGYNGVSDEDRFFMEWDRQQEGEKGRCGEKKVDEPG